ncbi:hypothetical protein ACQP3F_34415, partial [Escherichia coli]
IARLNCLDTIKFCKYRFRTTEFGRNTEHKRKFRWAEVATDTLADAFNLYDAYKPLKITK